MLGLGLRLDKNTFRRRTIITNLLGAYGNFINPTANLAQSFTTYDSTAISCVSGEQTFKATTQYGDIFFDLIPAYLNHKYYMCGYVKTASANVGLEFMDDPNFIPVLHSGSGNYEFLSVEYTKILNDDNLYCTVCDLGTTFNNITAKQMHCFDLTASFGTNIPTKGALDAAIKAKIDADGYQTSMYI